MWKGTLFLLCLAVFVALAFIRQPKTKEQPFRFTAKQLDSLRWEKFIKAHKRKARQEDLKQYLKVL